jgi:hypothetical protein
MIRFENTKKVAPFIRYVHIPITVISNVIIAKLKQQNTPRDVSIKQGIMGWGLMKRNVGKEAGKGIEESLILVTMSDHTAGIGSRLDTTRQNSPAKIAWMMITVLTQANCETYLDRSCSSKRTCHSNSLGRWGKRERRGTSCMGREL